MGRTCIEYLLESDDTYMNYLQVFSFNGSVTLMSPVGEADFTGDSPHPLRIQTGRVKVKFFQHP